MTREEIEIMNEDEIANAIMEAVHKANENPAFNYSVFQTSGIYFTLGTDDIWEISDDASCSPRGGWFPTIITGLSDSEHAFFEKAMKEIGFDDTFFNGVTGETEGLEWDDDYVEEAFENYGEEALDKYRKIKELFDSGKTPFESFNEFVIKSKRINLDRGTLYYWWEDAEDYIDLYDNISDTGEPRGEYDGIDDAEWLYILTNLKEYVVEPEEEDFSED